MLTTPGLAWKLPTPIGGVIPVGLRLRAQVERQALDTYGVQIQQVGIGRFSLPEATLAATVARMVLRTDAAPFDMLVRGPPGAALAAPEEQAVGSAR